MKSPKYYWTHHKTGVVVGSIIFFLLSYVVGIGFVAEKSEKDAIERDQIRIERGLPPIEPVLTLAEKQFMAEFEGTRAPSNILEAGNMWCGFLRNDRSDVVVFKSTTYSRILDSGVEDWAANLAYNAASRYLCPDDYRAWSASRPSIGVGPVRPDDWVAPQDSDSFWGPDAEDSGGWDEPSNDMERNYGPRS